MKKFLIAATLIVVTFSVPFACHLTKKAQLDCTTVPSTYSKDIAPIVTNNCMPCHGYGSKKGDFTSYQGLKNVATSGDLEQKVLIKQEMPPKGPLPDSLRKKIRCWLNNGALNN